MSHRLLLTLNAHVRNCHTILRLASQTGCNVSLLGFMRATTQFGYQARKF